MAKKILLFFILALTLAQARVFSATKASADKCYQAEVTDISGRKYFPAAKKAIAEARESIFMAMFKAGLRPYDDNSSVRQLAQELINAHKRGVKVEVILDQNIPFVENENIEEWQADDKNAWCYKMLKDAGIEVNYDTPDKYLHAKVLVIDNEAVIMGSANWTESALQKNFETNVLIRSPELAQDLLKGLREIKIEPGRQEQDSKPPMPISWRFLEDPKLAGTMMNRHDERAFDLYLLLLKDFNGDKEAKVTLDYDKFAGSLGFSGKMERAAYRRQIIRTARVLEKRYNLIKFNPQYAKEGVVFLLDYEHVEKTYGYPDKWYFEIPADYWEYGWNKKLSLRAKFCWLINLAYAGISNARPWWFASRETLSERFNVGIWMISKGMQELRRLNLIDVEYSPIDPIDPTNRFAKSYKLLALYEPAWLEGEWKRLEALYGADNLEKARRFAGIVFKENDPAVVEDVINKINTFGEKQVKKAFAVAAQKRPDNPKRNYLYVRGIILRQFPPQQK